MTLAIKECIVLFCGVFQRAANGLYDIDTIFFRKISLIESIQCFHFVIDKIHGFEKTVFIRFDKFLHFASFCLFVS